LSPIYIKLSGFALYERLLVLSFMVPLPQNLNVS